MFSDSSFRASTSMAGYRLCKSPGRHYNSEHICHIVQVPSQLSQATITSVPPASNGENYAFERSLTRSHHLSLCSGSISLPSYGHHVAQTFQLLHQLPLRNSLKSLTSDFQIHHLTVMQSWGRRWVPQAWGCLLGCCMPGLCLDQFSSWKHEVS